MIEHLGDFTISPFRFDVVFFRGNQTDRDDCFVLAKNLKSLREAKEARQQSGDIVVFAGTGIVVTDPTWLWDWEKDNSNSFAENMRVQSNKKLENESI